MAADMGARRGTRGRSKRAGRSRLPANRRKRARYWHVPRSEHIPGKERCRISLRHSQAGRYRRPSRSAILQGGGDARTQSDACRHAHRPAGGRSVSVGKNPRAPVPRLLGSVVFAQGSGASPAHHIFSGAPSSTTYDAAAMTRPRHRDLLRATVGNG